MTRLAFSCASLSCSKRRCWWKATFWSWTTQEFTMLVGSAAHCDCCWLASAFDSCFFPVTGRRYEVVGGGGDVFEYEIDRK
jgi:hypothetical protein